MLRKQLKCVESFADFLSHVSEELVCFGNAKNGSLNTWEDMYCVSQSIRGSNSAGVTRLTSLVTATKCNRLRVFNIAAGQRLRLRIDINEPALTPHHGGALSVVRAKQEVQALFHAQMLVMSCSLVLEQVYLQSSLLEHLAHERMP